jgi:hypothetical protein
MRRLALMLAWSLAVACEQPTLPPIPEPSQKPVERLSLSTCWVGIPPVSEFGWTLKIEDVRRYAARKPEVICRLAEALRVWMDGLGRALPDVDSGDWNRIGFVTFSPAIPPPPPLGQRMVPETVQRYELCADVPIRPRRFCVVMSEDLKAGPRFYMSHR